MKKIMFLLVLAMGVFTSVPSYAAMPVFDATNNTLATLQKAMDSAFQTVQKANMATLIKQAKEDYAEQIKIYQESVKIYDENVKIYNQAVQAYKWIDTNVGNARNLKTFLSCGFSDVQNLQQLSTSLNTTLNQTATTTNRQYNAMMLQQANMLTNSQVLQDGAKRGIEMQNYAQASGKIANQCDTVAQNMLIKLRTKDQVLESKVSFGTADMMQLLHANEQATIFIAEELARVNSNISSINRTTAKQLEIEGQNQMNKAQEAAYYQTLEAETINRGNSYTKQRDSRDRINGVFVNCRAF